MDSLRLRLPTAVGLPFAVAQDGLEILILRDAGRVRCETAVAGGPIDVPRRIEGRSARAFSSLRLS